MQNKLDYYLKVGDKLDKINLQLCKENSLDNLLEELLIKVLIMKVLKILTILKLSEINYMFLQVLLLKINIF